MENESELVTRSDGFGKAPAEEVEGIDGVGLTPISLPPQSAAMQTTVQWGFHDTSVRIVDFEYRGKPGESDKNIKRAAEAWMSFQDDTFSEA